MLSTQINSRAVWIVTLSATIALTGCSEAGCDRGAPSGGGAEEAPIPRVAPRGPRAEEVIATGVPLGSGVWLPGSGGGRLLALGATTGQAVVVDRGGRWQVTQVAQEGLVGLYRAGSGALTLASGTGRLLRLEVSAEGAVSVSGEAPVGETPRVVEVLPGGEAAWVLSRGEEAPLVRVELGGMQAGERRRAGEGAVDLELSLGGEALFVANLGSGDVSALDAATGEVVGVIKVEARPWRLFAAPGPGGAGAGRIYALHANSGQVSALDVASRQRVATGEAGAPLSGLAVSADGRWVYGLAAGEGALTILSGETLEVSGRVEVPVGSSEVLRLGEGIRERVVLSSGERGELVVWRPQGPGLREEGALSLGAAAGRMAPSPGGDRVWLIGPQVGRVGLFVMDEGGERR